MVYTPTPEEVLFARLHVRNNAGLLPLLVLLKCFQRLQYFPSLPDVPAPVVDHVRGARLGSEDSSGRPKS